MSLAKGTVLLLLLLLAAISCDAAPAAEECATVTQRLPTADLHQVSLGLPRVRHTYSLSSLWYPSFLSVTLLFIY